MNQEINRFLNPQGQLTVYPAKRKMQLRALVYLAQKLQEGTTYTESEVNGLLNTLHTFGDPATLRRDLCDHGLLLRSKDGRAYHLPDALPTIEELDAKYL